MLRILSAILAISIISTSSFALTIDTKYGYMNREQYAKYKHDKMMEKKSAAFDPALKDKVQGKSKGDANTDASSSSDDGSTDSANPAPANSDSSAGSGSTTNTDNQPTAQSATGSEGGSEPVQHDDSLAGTK